MERAGIAALTVRKVANDDDGLRYIQ